jgi:phosphomannomutase
MSHESIPIDGDDFNACFARFLRQLLDESHMQGQTVGSIGNVISNEAIERYITKLRVSYKKVPVGVKHLSKEVRQYEIGCYFENSGHGCLYFS